MALLGEAEQEQQRVPRRRRRRWVRKWIFRRCLFGQYNTLNWWGLQIFEVFPPHGAGDVPGASSMSEATHCQDDKISLREPVVNLLLILPTHINKYFKSSLFYISLFPDRELPWNLVSSWRSCSFFCPVAPVITTLHSRFESPHNIKSLFVPKVSHAIFQEYKAEVWQTPSTEDAWGSTTVPEQVEILITIDWWPNVVAWLQSRPIHF